MAEMTMQPVRGGFESRSYERRPAPSEFSEGVPRKRKRRRSEVTGDAVADAAAFLKSRAKQKATPGHGFSDHDLDQSSDVSFQVGMQVEHEMLGPGTIEEIEGIGELMRLTVSFGDAGRKRLLARFARLKVVDTHAD